LNGPRHCEKASFGDASLASLIGSKLCAFALLAKRIRNIEADASGTELLNSPGNPQAKMAPVSQADHHEVVESSSPASILIMKWR
jgi:hypothetical protein